MPAAMPVALNKLIKLRRECDCKTTGSSCAYIARNRTETNNNVQGIAKQLKAAVKRKLTLRPPVFAKRCLRKMLLYSCYSPSPSSFFHFALGTLHPLRSVVNLVLGNEVQQICLEIRAKKLPAES